MFSTKFKILIVDDDPKFVDDLIFLLQNDFPCTGVGSGEEALALMAKRDFDALLLDIGLGSGMDGFEVMRQMRR
ncbi:MAG: response regulator transcription factor [bacterium]